MKILHFIYDHINNPWVGGGGAVRAYEIYRRLADRHQIIVVCGKYPGAEDYSEEDMKFHFVGTSRNNYILSTFCYAFEAARFLKRNKDSFAVVIEDFAPYNPVFSFLIRKDAIIQLHQKEGLHHFKKYLFLGTPFFLIEKFYPNVFKNIIVVSEKSKAKYDLDENATVISNGFDESFLSIEESEGDYILFLGRLHINQKGLDTLKESFKDLREDARLVIAGSGKDEKKVGKLFAELRQKGKAQIVGFVKGEKKTGYMKNCKFMVMPSRYEGQPLTSLEAAACGKPVIVSDIPELKYAVDAGFGVSFRTGNAKDLAEKINFLLNNPDLRREMGKKAREYARDFTWDKIAEKYENYLEEVVERHNRTNWR